MVRGQVTIFIILGLLVVLAVGMVLYFTSAGVVFRQGVIVPREGQPVYDYVTSCLNQLAEEGIRLQGLQGGYLEIPQDIARTPTSFIPMDDRDIVRIPLWQYERENRVPTIGQMERELATYINSNLPVCLDDFNAFKEQYPVTINGTPATEVTIGESTVDVSLDYNIIVTRGEKTVTLTEFITPLDVNFKRAYDLAVAVLKREDDEAWFENLTVDLMTADPAIPFDGLEFDCSPKKWYLTDIKSEVQDVLRINLPTIRIKNTQYAPFEESERAYAQAAAFTRDDFFLGRYPKHTPEDSYEHQRMWLDVGVAKTPLAAKFLYQPEWGMDLTGDPNRGGVLSSKVSKGAKQYLSFLCTNFYHYTYDVIYPIVFRAQDEKAFRGTGFTFQMAFPVVIDDNEGARKTFGYRQFQGFEPSTGFCEDLSGTLIEVRALGLEPGIGVVEQGDATIDYECVTQSCTLGTTTADNGAYTMKTRLPAGCRNPSIIAKKEGFLPAKAVAKDNYLALTMPRLREMKLEVRVHPYDPVTQAYAPGRALRDGENVTLAISYLNSSYDQFISYPGTDTIQVVDGSGSYAFNAILNLFDTLVGGYRNQELIITPTDLAATDTIRVHVLEVTPVLQTDAYRKNVAGVLASEEYADELRPEFR